MEQLTFEPIVHPDTPHPTPIHLDPQAIEELYRMMAAAILALFQGGETHAA